MARLRAPEWSHGAIGALIRSVAALVRAGGLDDSRSVLCDIGSAFAGAEMNRARVQRAIDNLAWSFPEWSESQVRSVAMESYRNLFGLVAEMCHAPSMFSPERWPERVTLSPDPVTHRAIGHLISRRPCVLITGHCGNWEVLGMTVAHFGFDLHALYRPLELKPLDDWVRKSRATHGLRLLDKFGAIDELPKIIERSEPVGFIADQNAGPGGLFVPFFDRLASTYKSIGLLALRHRIPILCGQAMRIRLDDGGGVGYRIVVRDVIEPEECDSQPDPLFYVTARYRRALEEMVRAAPEQYLWMHRYWKSRPRFEKKGHSAPPALMEKIRALPWMTEERAARIEERSARDAEEAARTRR